MSSDSGLHKIHTAAVQGNHHGPQPAIERFPLDWLWLHITVNNFSVMHGSNKSSPE